MIAAAQAGEIRTEVLTASVVLIFMGAMGKSAQFPFHVWLPDAMEGPAPVSALIHAATMGLVMTDIKRVIAYSTINSLGLMFVALGMGAPAAAMLYLFTHGFFKAMLFLGSGSVIHATEQQDVSKLGGLWSKMPVTGMTFALGALSMAGLPFLAGFWAKDEILVGGLDNHAVFALLLLTLPITAMYMTRLFIDRKSVV